MMFAAALPHIEFRVPPAAGGSAGTPKRRSRSVAPCMSLQQQRPPNPNLLTTITRLLWGQSLPPNVLISTARSAWSAAWHLMMSQLAPSSPSGAYSRPPSRFRTDPHSLQSPCRVPGAMHLYVSLPCPWAHRTLIVRVLKGLEESVPVSVASPGMDGSFEFRDRTVGSADELAPGLDNANACRNLKEVYKLRIGGYDGRCTVPMLWDVGRKEVVCNESYDIIELFNSGFNGVVENTGLDLSPLPLMGKIKEWNEIIYPRVNNGVYRCGFAQSQAAYDVAVNELFSTLDMLDHHLGSSRFLCGDGLTLADICLFTTLIRFDLVYNILFKCTKKKVVEYHNLHAYVRDIYQIPKVAATCNFQAIADGYYKTLFPLNPGGICPVTPTACLHEQLSKPHCRESLSVTGTTPQLCA